MLMQQVGLKSAFNFKDFLSNTFLYNILINKNIFKKKMFLVITSVICDQWIENYLRSVWLDNVQHES